MPDAAAPGRASAALALLTAAYLLSYLDRTVVALLVGPIRTDLAISDTQFSLLGGLAFALFYSVLGIPLGALADRGRRRWLIAAGIALWSAMTMLCGFASSFAMLFAARVGVGIGEAALSPAAYALITEMFPPASLGRALALYGSGVYLGIGSSFLLGGWLIERLGDDWGTVFLLFGAPGLVLAPLAAAILPADRRRTVTVEAAPLAAFLSRQRRFLACHFAGFAMLTLAFNGFLAWESEYLLRAFAWSKAGSGVAIGAIVLVAGTSGMVLGGVATDALRRRGDARGPLTAAFGAAALMLPLPAVATTVVAPAIGLVGFGGIVFLSAFCFGPAVAALQMVAPPEMRARVSALYLLVVNLAGIGLGGTAVALVSDHVLHDEARLGEAMAGVGLAALALAVPLLWLARRAMADAR